MTLAKRNTTVPRKRNPKAHWTTKATYGALMGVVPGALLGAAYDLLTSGKPSGITGRSIAVGATAGIVAGSIYGVTALPDD